MTNLTQESKCYSAGLKMLMRREHSRLELFQKLQTKGFDVDVVNNSISKLVEQNYQSDDRFSEEFIQMRFNQGKGPVKIASELKMRGINTFDLSVFDWFQLAKEIRQRKFGDLSSLDFKETAKQKRFLQSRGFTLDQINQAF
ncbi:MAG: regulatory protein RecX [Candidatus Pseudothioglobus sp.]|jgi:regulatory protein|nr:regulatory protein RecX [Candidatus Thioglobus sp.]|tara:strand:+ start:893 stop:1318 length:426 start_codon:yes stop_codon:yes gene_type:complete